MFRRSIGNSHPVHQLRKHHDDSHRPFGGQSLCRELQPIGQENGRAVMPVKAGDEAAVIDKLRSLKAALDEGLITQEEYEAAKAKILNEDY